MYCTYFFASKPKKTHEMKFKSFPLFIAMLIITDKYLEESEEKNLTTEIKVLSVL